MKGTTIEGSLALHDVWLKINRTEILKSISLQLKTSAIHVIIGANGAGKSTLLKCIARTIQPTSGSVSLNGHPVASIGARDFSRKVAYVPQTFPVVAGVTVRELVTFGRYPWRGAVGRLTETDFSRIETALHQTDLNSLAECHLQELSGGQRQRAWIAMALAQDTEWLLLDEPTSALDVASQLAVLRLLPRLVASRKIGVVMVLHDLNLASRFANNLIAMQHGQVLQQGEPQLLLQPIILEAIYGIPMGVIKDPDSDLQLSFVR